MSVGQRVAKNTLFLYAKMGITVFMSLYTTRLVLSALGTSDFGIFNIVGGAIAMLGFLNASMASATQRFMSHAEGEGDENKQRQVFNISTVIHFFTALIVGVCLFVFGYFFFNGILNIEVDRIYSAKVIYTCLIISTMMVVMTVPYDAVLNARENMLYYSIVGVIEALLKLLVAICVVYFPGDKLVIYGILMSFIPLVTMLGMRIYCHRKYSECVIAPTRYWNPSLMKSMLKYSSWSLLGASTGMISQYGLSIVLNVFFGTILNAAQGVANQISGQLMVFSNTMIKALNPVINKTEGAGNRFLMLKAALGGARFSYCLLVVFAIPFIIEAPYILKIWLDRIPDWAILFTRLQLIRSLVEQLTIPFWSAIAAKGNIRAFTIFKSFLNCLPIVLTYILFSYGYPPYSLYIVWIIAGGLLGGSVILFFVNKECGLKYSDFFQQVFFPCIAITFVMLVSGLIVNEMLETSFFRLLSVASITTLVFLLAMWFFFLSKEEKRMIMEFVIRYKTKSNLLGK